jgi:Integrase core domain
VRFLLCLGVEPNVIPPHRPDLNAYVERFHRTLSQECLRVQLPRTGEQVWETTETFLLHYNSERPNQARSCGNQPPRVACPVFPTLPALPQMVDPDRWLERMNEAAFARTIQSGGGITINHEDYYVSRALAGQRIMCVVNAAEKQFDLWQPGGG